jgi:HemY protein
MLKHSETEFLAANELGKQARISGNHAQALTYAEHAYKAKPTDRESAYTLAISYSKEGRWQEAERVINQATRKHVFNRTKKAHLLCIILYEQAQRLLAEGNNDSALSFAENAHKKDRQFLPAIMLLAELRLKAGKRLGVSRLIHNTWKYSPHPALAEIFTKLYAGEKSAKQLKQISWRTPTTTTGQNLPVQS